MLIRMAASVNGARSIGIFVTSRRGFLVLVLAVRLVVVGSVSIAFVDVA